MKKDRNTLYKAFYQYLADHTIPTPKGPAVSFLLMPEAEFKRRVRAREKGFKRVHAEDILENVNDYRDKLPYVKKAKQTVEKFKKHYLKKQAKREMMKEADLLLRVANYLNAYTGKYIAGRVASFQKKS